MITDEIGGEGNWSLELNLSTTEDIQGGLKAFSPSPKDGSADINYSLPVVFSVLDGEQLSLESSNWKLISYNDVTNDQSPIPVLKQTAITAKFDDSQVSGSSGCNQYFGPYTTKDNSISIGPIGSTLMACPEPIMDQEQQYLSLLQSSTTYKINNNSRLTMWNKSGALTLIFEAQQTITLENTPWQAQGINNSQGGVVSNATTSFSTAIFQNNTISGNASCNQYQGSYEASNTSISIGPLSTTRKACEPELMEQEQQFLTALENSNTYQIQEDKLNLRQDDSTMVNFTTAQSQ